MMSREYWIFAIGVLVYLIYKKGKTIDTETGDGQPQDGSSTSRLRGVAPSNICIPPAFKVKLKFDGRNCAGSYIDESKVLKLGDSGCDVLLLQQRLNRLVTSNILTPTGRFDCDTLNKLRNVKGVDTISLSMFQPDEEVGFEEFVPTRITNMRYAPSDVDQLNGQKPIY